MVKAYLFAGSITGSNPSTPPPRLKGNEMLDDLIGKIICADCLDILKQLPDKCVDLVCTDCPYHIVSGGCTTGAFGNDDAKNKPRDSHGIYYKEGSKHVSLYGILNDYDPTTYMKNGKVFKHNDIEFERWLPEIYRVLKDNTHCYIMINGRNLAELQTKAENVGFEFQQLLVWEKGNTTPNRYYLNACEFILMLRKGGARNINDMGYKNILSVPNPIGDKCHPTEKPVGLMEILIANSTNENDIVLEPFAGAGATCIAARNLKRRFIGIEIDETYCETANKRLEMAQQQTLF